MSSLSVAAAARAALFTLEALEPRRLLSGGAEASDAIPFNIDAGVQLSGSFLPADGARLSFEAREGETYFLTENSWDSDVNLVEEDATTVIAPIDKYNGLAWTAPGSGTFYLAVFDPFVHKFYDKPDHYQINARVYRDDLGDGMTDAAPLAPDTPVTAHLDGQDDVDWFSFEAQLGHVYRINTSTLDIPGEEFAIYGSDGLIEVGHYSYYDQLILKPASSGTYYVKVSHDPYPQGPPGNLYQLKLDVLTDDAPDDFASAAPWDLSKTLSGALDYAGDNDYFRFEAKAGDSYIFNQIQGLTTSILDSDGTGELAKIPDYSGEDDVQGELIWTAPHDGTFYVAITDWTGFMAFMLEGPYTIRALPLRDGGPATHLAAGETLSASLDQPAEMDHFTFDATAGKEYEFYIADPAAAKSYVVQIRGPQSTSEAHPGSNIHTEAISYNQSLTDTASWVASESGTFQVDVTAFDASLTGEYTLTMTSTADGVGNDVTHAALLPVGIGAQGRIDYENDADVFNVNAVAGHRYAVSMVPSDSADPWFQVWLDWGVDGRWPDGLECSDVDLIQRCVLTASETRSYPVTVIGDEGRPNYTIEALDITSQFPAAGYQALASGQPVSLNFDGSGDIHFFKIDAEAGKTYQFATSATWRKLDFHFVDAAGATVQPRFGELPARGHRGERGELAYTFAESGTCYIAIASFDPSMVGQVQLYFDEESDAEAADAPTLPPPEPRPTPIANALIATAGGSLNSEGETGFFTFHAVAGRSYRFRTVLGTLGDSILGLFDPLTQKVIAVNDDTDDESLWDDDVQQVSSEVRWTADRSGDVYLIVYGFDQESTGTYRLEVYSTREKLQEETLAALAALPARANEMVLAVDDKLNAYVQDGSDVWDDSQDNWNDSSLIDSNVWDEGEDLEEI